MGCDIHGCFEAAMPWKNAPDVATWTHMGEMPTTRDYELFAVIAGVRNDMLDIVSISEPKGLPTKNLSDDGEPWIDCNGHFEAYAKACGISGHSHSWLALDECRAYDQNRDVDDKSLVYSKDEHGNILGTCYSTTGKHFGPVGVRKLFRLFKDTQSGPTPLDKLIGQMQEIAGRHNLPDDQVRMVFFFDN